ncbi:MAG: hypothetical protein V3R67_07925 [Thermodesulfobacteriota bacterium]
MGLLFDRKIQVSFGKAGDLGTRVKNLFIQFDIKKNSEPSPNKGTITIYNLNEVSRAALQSKDMAALLEIGYESFDLVEELASGKIHKAVSMQQGKDWITIIDFGDGLKNLSEASINVSFAPGATGKQVLSSLVKNLGAGVGAIKGLVDVTFQNGLIASGPVKHEIDKIADLMGLEWSIQDGNFQILPRLVPSEKSTILLSPETGLQGSPTQREDAKKGGKYLEFVAKPRAIIKPGNAVQILSREIDGFYKIRTARFRGDNRTGPFEMLCEAVEIASGATLPNEKLI